MVKRLPIIGLKTLLNIFNEIWMEKTKNIPNI